MHAYVSANGGTPELLIKGTILNAAKEGFPVVPRMLPDRKTVLFTNYTGSDVSNWQVGIQSLKWGSGKF